MSAVRITIMGVGGVGKSALTHRLVEKKFVAKYDPTVEDSHTTSIEVDGVARSLEILDTAGQEEYSALRAEFMHKGDGFILVFSITNDSSFTDLKKIRDSIMAAHPLGENTPLMLVGNKMDLDSERAVLENEGKRMANSWGCEYMECSAKANTNVTELFVTFTRNILKTSTDPNKGGGGGTVMGAGKKRAAAPAPPKKSKCAIL